ncbi:DUF6644 family protein [Adhaeribacter radiodurans]|uniref:DUF6644 domain-containing protein n=1 Tax=Adhaeribacter radiodurans TaxID=2745197 RepID=A0A7L7LD68_9BACT|nr:DUF6644 family protein [Adhaeribacter radiodurans]QMU30707.1 hypothetical protein HUW48_22955 [Adhaeribacter radiodurans]
MVNWLDWLEHSALAIVIRRSSWLYPALEIVHIIGIALLVGAAFLFDLRLLGFSRHLPVVGLANHLLTWSRRGLILIVPSGILLFSTNAVALGQDFTFWLKIAAIVLAGLNALVFHTQTFPALNPSDKNYFLPVRAKLSALCSLILWTVVIACGRLLAY